MQALFSKTLSTCFHNCLRRLLSTHYIFFGSGEADRSRLFHENCCRFAYPLRIFWKINTPERHSRKSKMDSMKFHKKIRWRVGGGDEVKGVAVVTMRDCRRHSHRYRVIVIVPSSSPSPPPPSSSSSLPSSIVVDRNRRTLSATCFNNKRHQVAFMFW